MSKLLIEILHDIQRDLKAPKNQFNSFGKYKYRSCEDILEGVKPLLPEGVSLVLNDEVVAVGDRIYVKATASLKYKAEQESASAFAREPLSKKGMDEAQITGSASSYARKYALNGLFCIDDTKDADTQAPPKEEPKQLKPVSAEEHKMILDDIKNATTEDELAYARANALAAHKRMDKKQTDEVAKEIETTKKALGGNDE